MVRSIKSPGTSIPYVLLGLFWGAALRKVPAVRHTFYTYTGFLSADTIYAGCLGSPHVGHNPDGDHALLVMG